LTLLVFRAILRLRFIIQTSLPGSYMRKVPEVQEDSMVARSGWTAAVCQASFPRMNMTHACNHPAGFVFRTRRPMLRLTTQYLLSINIHKLFEVARVFFFCRVR